MTNEYRTDQATSIYDVSRLAINTYQLRIERLIMTETNNQIIIEDKYRYLALKAVVFSLAFTLITTGLLLVISAITCYLIQGKL